MIIFLYEVNLFLLYVFCIFLCFGNFDCYYYNFYCMYNCKIYYYYCNEYKDCSCVCLRCIYLNFDSFLLGYYNQVCIYIGNF